MDFSRLQRGEFVAIIGGIALLVGLFLDWYTTGDTLGSINGIKGPQTGWDVHTIIRYPLAVAAVAPLILAYIIARDNQLSWPRGELTAVIAIAAFGLILYNGFITQPGTSNELTTLKPGIYLSLLGTVLMLSGSSIRSSKVERKRKPPGTL